MHILVIPSWYSTPANPLRGSFFREQALALRQAGHQVGLLVPPSKLRTWNGLAEVRRNWRTANDTLTVSDDEGMPIYRIPWWGWWPSVYMPGRVALARRVYERYYREQGEPDVIHAHGILYGGYMAAHLRQAFGKPVVVTENASVYVRRLIFPDQARRAAWALRTVDRFFAVNPRQAEALRQLAPGVRIDLIQNSTDVEFFTFSPPPPPSPFLVLMIANLNPNKGVDILLKAFKEAFGGAEARLQIVGDGTERAALEKLAERLGITAQVEFTGRVPRTGVREAIQKSHVIVSASYFEMLPFNLIEALASGRPVVATHSGGADVLVNERNGLLVPTGDPAAMALALRRMRDTYPQYDLEAIRAETVATYSDDALVKRLTGIYEELLSSTLKQATAPVQP
jgi:glycosyltransferase involved in cell wall biosynthesis